MMTPREFYVWEGRGEEPHDAEHIIGARDPREAGEMFARDNRRSAIVSVRMAGTRVVDCYAVRRELVVIDLFAAFALAGNRASEAGEHIAIQSSEEIAASAYGDADAMLRARAEREAKPAPSHRDRCVDWRARVDDAIRSTDAPSVWRNPDIAAWVIGETSSGVAITHCPWCGVELEEGGES